ncbi:hypothetical protein K469DRAFT_466395, partial [Zopfia rhizophila CBS 207.26]
RRSTLAGISELDHGLANHLLDYQGFRYLPLSTEVIRLLSYFYTGARPVADMTMFRRLLINGDVNNMHADHVISALEHIGIACTNLAIVSPIYTSEYGDVFNREQMNISPSNDWLNILKQLPNLSILTFEHPSHVPADLLRHTFFSIHCAIA